MYRDEDRRRGLSIPQTPFDDERSNRNLREGAIGQLGEAAKKLTPMSQLKSELKHDMFEAVEDVAEKNHIRFPRSKHVKGGMKTVYTTPDSMPLYNTPVLAPWYTDKPSGELEVPGDEMSIDISYRKLAKGANGKSRKGSNGLAKGQSRKPNKGKSRN